MISIVELYNLVAIGYLNCYKAYIELLSGNTNPNLRYDLCHRMHIYYEILEVIYDSFNE